MKRLISKSTATNLLTHHLPTLQRCLHDAWSEWQKLRDEQLARGNELSPTARARIIYDTAVSRARAAFAEIPEVLVSQKHGFLVLVFGQQVAIRFKKLRNNLLPSGVRTRQQEMFATQEEIPGIPDPATYLIAGYVLDAAQVRIERLVVTCADGLGLRWVLDLEANGESSAISIGATAPAPIAPHVHSSRGIAKDHEEAQ